MYQRISTIGVILYNYGNEYICIRACMCAYERACECVRVCIAIVIY